MTRKATSAAVCVCLALLVAAPAAAAYGMVASTPHSARAPERSLASKGHSLRTGGRITPVPFLYGDRLYVALRYAAAVAEAATGWLPFLAKVSAGSGHLPSWSHLLSPEKIISGTAAVPQRSLRQHTGGQPSSPNGVLPAAAQPPLTVPYIPGNGSTDLSLLDNPLNPLVWPPIPPTAQDGEFSVSISLPVFSLQPGSVLSVRADVSGAAPGDPLDYRWSLRAPDGLLAPMLGGNAAAEEQIPVGANAQRGSYTLEITVKDGRTGQATSATASFTVAGAPPAGLAAPPFGFSPPTIARAYNIYNSWLSGDFGQGNAIVLYERQGFSFADLSAFDNAFGLPAPNIQVETPGGTALAPGLEATMDVEWAHALAPLAQLVVVEDVGAGSASDFPQQLVASLDSAVQSGADIASVSYGVTPSSRADAGPDQEIANLLGQGLSVFAAGGDNFDTGGAPPFVWPAVDPNVVAVGGTSLFERNPATYFETYWDQPTDASTFGVTSWPALYWQSAVTGNARRTVPDVAFDGDPRTGVAVYLDGGWWIAGGTSLGAPAWAAVWALCRTAVPAVPSAQQALYTVAASRYDAGALRNPNDLAYDQRTGLGTPNVANLISALRALY